jgi:hypothetical protein
VWDSEFSSYCETLWMSLGGRGECPNLKLLNQANFTLNRKVHFGFHQINIPLIKVLLDLIE